MRILAVTNLFPSIQRPTRGLFNLQAFEALSRICDVRVLAPVPWIERVKHPADLLRTPNMKHGGLKASYPTSWYLPRVAPGMQEAALERSLLPHVRRMRKSFPFDAVLAAWAYPDGAAAVRLAHRYNAACVTMVLGSDVNAQAARPELHRRISDSLSRADCVITVSEALAKRSVELGVSPQRVRVQHNGVDGQRFLPRDPVPIRRKLGLPVQDKVVTFVGNLVPEKGPDLLIRAIAQLPPAERPLTVLVGDGPAAPELRNLSQDLGVADRIRFVGRRPFTEIPDWLSAGDAHCLTSRREGCPNVILEALASGRPVVSFAVGGVPEILRPECGRLVAPEDPAAFATSLREVLATPFAAEELRASVPFLSWDAFAGRLATELEFAIASRVSRTAEGCVF